MAGKDAEKDGEEAKGGGKMKIIIAVVLVLALGGGGYWFFLRPKEEGPKTLPPPVAGAVVAVDPITINLAGGHFLKLGLGLQAVSGAHEEPTGEKALDLAINQFSGKTVAELSTAEGRRKNKEELVARIKLAYVAHEATETEETTPAEEGEDAEDHAEEDSHGKELTAEEAIAEAAALTVQPDVYDVYFTEFVMQ